MPKIVCISDTHCQLDRIDLPEGDILVHSGDLTYRGRLQETLAELIVLRRKARDFKHVILVEGNHDWLGQKDPASMDQFCKDHGIILLRDSAIQLEGLNFYGSPWQPEFCNWAFNLPRGEALKKKWDMIPQNTEVLLTHSPPHGILDCVERFVPSKCEFELEHVGCEELYKRVMDLPQLRLHSFGHLHLSHGTMQIGNTMFVNAANCTEQYKPINRPIVIEL